MTLREELHAVFLGKCPDCGGSLKWGPRGDMSQNAACLKCHNRYNVSLTTIERYGKVEVDKNGKVYW